MSLDVEYFKGGVERKIYKLKALSKPFHVVHYTTKELAESANAAAKNLGFETIVEQITVDRADLEKEYKDGKWTGNWFYERINGLPMQVDAAVDVEYLKRLFA